VEAYMGKAAGNATKAAKLAGYSQHTARQQATRMLSKPHIRSAISSRAENDPNVATREERQRFWSDAMRGKIARFDSKDRLKASELLGKASGDFLDRLANPDGSPIQAPTLVVVTRS
jgi:phage terminase small subunit